MFCPAVGKSALARNIIDLAFPVNASRECTRRCVVDDGSELLVSVEGPVGILTLNRPECRNALNPGLLKALSASLDELVGREEVRCVVLRGAGGEAFSAGMDLKEFASGGIQAVEEGIRPGGLLTCFLDAIEECPLPVIASIEGWCLGAGCEMSMACDLRLGSEGCRMGMPPARLGIVYPPGGLQRFLRAIGPAQTRKVFLTARYFDAAEALGMGMLHYVAADGQLEELAMQLAAEIAPLAPLAVAGLKRSLYHLTRPASLSGEAELEMEALAKNALESRDTAEALEAFNQKRDPKFRGE